MTKPLTPKFEMEISALDASSGFAATGAAD
jgi:hypothetical protein